MIVFLRLIRAANLPTVWFNTLCAVVLSFVSVPELNIETDWTFHSPIISIALLSVIYSLFYSAGMVQNDVADIHWDKKFNPARPLIKGQVSYQTARIVTNGFFVLAWLLFSVYFGVFALIGGAALICTITAYNVIHKHTRLAIIFMAACRLQIYIFTSLVLCNRLIPEIAVIAGIQFLYTLAITAVSRYEQNRKKTSIDFRYPFPVIPWMIAGMCFIDGLYLSIVTSNWFWLPAGLIAALMTRIFQKQLRAS